MFTFADNNTNAKLMEEAKDENKVKRWFKRVGILGFFFFLAKGLVWLYIFYAAGKCATS